MMKWSVVTCENINIYHLPIYIFIYTLSSYEMKFDNHGLNAFTCFVKEMCHREEVVRNYCQCISTCASAQTTYTCK